MHGLGNDFVVIDCINQNIDLSKNQIQFIANRDFGIGCDQLLLVESSDTKQADFRYRIFNSDGAEVEQCGNGARCFAIFVRDEGLTDKTTIPVVTNTGLITLNIEDDGQVTVDMGVPILTPEEIPFTTVTSAASTTSVTTKQAKTYTINVAGQSITLGAVSVGNPHAVIIVNDIESAPVEELGKLVQADKHFPNSVNVGFMQVVDTQNIILRVYERGVGETQACGTGACAAVIAGHIQGLLSDTVAVKLLGGNLSIHWAGDKNPVMMTGSTATVFKGMITIK